MTLTRQASPGQSLEVMDIHPLMNREMPLIPSSAWGAESLTAAAAPDQALDPPRRAPRRRRASCGSTVVVAAAAAAAVATAAAATAAVAADALRTWRGALLGGVGGGPLVA
jgi:hypothetical protein